MGEIPPEGGRVVLAVEGGLVLEADAKGDADGLLPKIDGPLASANGEAVDAYARNPPCHKL